MLKSRLSKKRHSCLFILNIFFLFCLVLFIRIIKKISLRSTRAIHASFFTVLRKSKMDLILKSLYATKSFKCFKFRINLKVELFFFQVKTVELKPPDSQGASTATPFLRRDLISTQFPSFSETLWGIGDTFRFPGTFKKSILSQFVLYQV